MIKNTNTGRIQTQAEKFKVPKWKQKASTTRVCIVNGAVISFNNLFFFLGQIQQISPHSLLADCSVCA